MTNTKRLVPELRFPEFSGEWEKRKLKDIAKFQNGKAHEKLVSISGDFVLVNSKFISTNTQVKKFVSQQLTPLNKEDIAIVMSDIPNGKALAKCFLVNENNKYTLNQRIGRIYDISGDSRFLYAILNRNTQLLKYDNGVGQTNLKKSEITHIALKCPINAEQKKIGDFFSKLDRQIELEKEKLELLEQQKKGYMQKIFSQEIRFKDDNGNSYPEWESAPLFDIFSATKGKSLSKDKISNDGKYECILYGEIYTTYAEKIESIVSRTNYYEGILSQKNDLIFPNSTTTNAWDLATFSSLQKNNVLIGGDISILRTKRSDISSLFYAYYLTNYLKLRKDIAKYAQGITIVHLSFNNFCKIKVQIPSLEEQNSITDFIDSLNQQQKLITNKIKLLKERKKGFLQKMFI